MFEFYYKMFKKGINWVLKTLRIIFYVLLNQINMSKMVALAHKST